MSQTAKMVKKYANLRRRFRPMSEQAVRMRTRAAASLPISVNSSRFQSGDISAPNSASGKVKPSG